MAVNFGTFEGHRILSDSTNKTVDRLLNAVKEKQRQEEEKKRLELEQNRFKESKRQFDERLEFDQGVSDRDYEFKEKDFIQSEIERYQNTTGYAGVAQYDDEGNFIGVTSPLKDGKKTPTFAKTTSDRTFNLEERKQGFVEDSFKKELQYKYDLKDQDDRQFFAKLDSTEAMALDRLILDYDKMDQDWAKFSESIALEADKLGFDISKWDDTKIMQFKQFAENQRQFNVSSAQKDKTIEQNQQQIDSNLQNDEQNRIIKAYNLDQVKKGNKKIESREDNVALFNDIISSLPASEGTSSEEGITPSLLDVALFSDAQLNNMLIEAGGKALDAQGIKEVRQNIKDQKTRNVSAYELDMVPGDDPAKRMVFGVEGEVPADLNKQMLKKTGNVGGINSYDINDSSNDDTTTLLNTVKASKFQNDIVLDGDTELSFSKPSKRKVDYQKDGTLLNAWKKELTKIARDNDDLDDMDIRANNDGTYTLSEWDPLFNDTVKIKVDENGNPMFLDPDSGEYVLLGANLDAFLDELK